MSVDVWIPIRLRFGCEMQRKGRVFLLLLDPLCQFIAVGVHAGAPLLEKAADWQCCVLFPTSDGPDPPAKE